MLAWVISGNGARSGSLAGDRGSVLVRQPMKSSGRTSSAASGDSPVRCAQRPSTSFIASSGPMR